MTLQMMEELESGDVQVRTVQFSPVQVIFYHFVVDLTMPLFSPCRSYVVPRLEFPRIGGILKVPYEDIIRIILICVETLEVKSEIKGMKLR